MVTVVVPGPLRDLNGGRSTLGLDVNARTVGEAFDALRAHNPALWDRIFTEQRELRPHVNVFVGSADIRWSGGLETPVREEAEVVILPSVSGG
ncbi:MAG TPA: MoaD/ThiS family protein [Longimicrobiales bacterium]|nr:MoaD/ThiS family protein [Longimicrobiales bacterium]